MHTRGSFEKNPPPEQVSNFATKAKLGAHTKISINAVGTVIRHRSKQIDGFNAVAERATIAMHSSHRARGIRAYF